MNASFPKCNQAGIEFVISMNEELQEESMFLSEEFPIAMYTQSFIHAASDSVPFHWHDELQVTWILEGELEYSINGDKFRLGSDRLLLISSHQLHSSHTTAGDAKTLCINFTTEIFHPFILKKYIKPLLDSHAFSYSLLRLKPDQITMLKEFQNWTNEPLGYFSVMNLLSQVFEEILKGFEEDRKTPDLEETRLFQEMLSFVHTNFSKPLCVKDIADSAILNKNRCTDLFKKYTNRSPIKYLNEYRLYAAKNMILHTDKSISEISADVGYNQISHFIEQFRLSYGMSPLKYRNQFVQRMNCD